MRRRLLASFSLSALMLGGATMGCAADGGAGIASAGSRPAGNAAASADKASRALARHRPDQAVPAAERAVALRPDDAGFRTLLGQSYLKAGRFTAARQAFADVLRLSPEDGKAALDLALAQIGTGDWAGARRTLAVHEATINAGDRGLALALAGDPEGGTAVLMEAARSPDATVTTRQNLGLALALAGRWQEARIVAATDLSPADVDKRMADWAALAQPRSASDQVAAVLGVQPAVDAGQPAALALVAPAPAVAATPALAAAPVPTATPTPVARQQPLPVPGPVAVPQPAVVPSVAAAAIPVIRPAAAPIRIALAAPTTRAPAGGGWFVQFGAYRTQTVARDGWAKIVQRDAALRGRTPMAATFQLHGVSLTRVAVGNFTRFDADRMCHAFKVKGGDCFVRAGAGEQVASWAKRPTVQLAAR